MKLQVYILLIALFFPVPGLFAHHPENPAGTFELEWSREQIAHVYAVGVFQTLGLRVDNDPSRAGVRNDNGQNILHGIALAFDIDDQYLFDIDQDVRITLEMEVTNLNHFYLTYDKNGTVNASQKVDIKSGSKGWQKVEIILERARFANRGFGKTDLAVASERDMSNVLLFIRDIKVESLNNNQSNKRSGLLELSIRNNESKDLVAAQVGLYDESGRMPLPTESAIELQIFETYTRSIEIREELDQLNWPHDNHFSMVVDGYYRAMVPEGEYDLIVSKGPEYPIIVQRIAVQSSGTNKAEVFLDHNLNMPSKGWYSGDVHNHLSRPNASYNANQMAHARAADLHMHWLYALGNSVNTYFEQYAWGQEGDYSERDYFIGSGQEDPRTDFLGHVLAMGHQEFVRYPDEYFHYDKVSKKVHEQGGVFGIAHMDFAQFQQKVALALLAPENEIDFVEIFQYHTLHLEDWYAFLNLGFKLPAAAGSDWPYMSLPGSVRTYVDVGNEFTPKSWNENLKAGKTFVSNGPVLEFTVNGQGIGSTLNTKKGETIKVTGHAVILPSWDRLKYGAFVINGEIVKEIEIDAGQEEIHLEYEYEIEESSWMAFKVYGEKHQEIVFQTPYTKRIQAHSSPIYVEVNNEPTWVKSKAPVIIDQLVNRLESVKEMKYQRNDNEAWESPDRTAELLEMFRPYLRSWIDETVAFYLERKERIIK